MNKIKLNVIKEEKIDNRKNNTVRPVNNLSARQVRLRKQAFYNKQHNAFINSKKFKINDDTTMEYMYVRTDDNKDLNRLFRNYKPNQLKEKHPKSLGTSFTLNKKDVILCLKKNNGKSMVDENTLFFVLLHEISHIMTKSIGHQEDYWENFRFLLAHAIVANLYEFDSYKNEKRYCGINISSSPIKLNEIENYIQK